MNFDDTPQEAAFRKAARAWVTANAPNGLQKQGDIQTAARGDRFIASAKTWQKKKADAGWACLNWPKEYGGRGATPIERVIWQQEEGDFVRLRQPFRIGEGMCCATRNRVVKGVAQAHRPPERRP